MVVVKKIGKQGRKVLIPSPLAHYVKLIKEYDNYVDKHINSELKSKQYTHYKKKYDDVSSKLSEEYKLLLDMLGDQHLQQKLTETQKATVDIIYPEVRSRVVLTPEQLKLEEAMQHSMAFGFPNTLGMPLTYEMK